jgi:hypothetical protein
MADSNPLVDTGIRSLNSPTGIMEQSEPTNVPTPMVGDAIPGLGRISRG